VDARDVDPRDDAADRPLAQERGERFDLGQLGHGRSLLDDVPDAQPHRDPAR
jgi:hypothetical protein